MQLQLTNQTLTFFVVIKALAAHQFCLCALTTMISMLTMADGVDDNLKVKIVQPSPLFKANVCRHFGFKATKNHQLLLMATIYPCFYFVLLTAMLRLT